MLTTIHGLSFNTLVHVRMWEIDSVNMFVLTSIAINRQYNINERDKFYLGKVPVI